MIILVTGSTGFIGNYVIEKLLLDGHSVKATSSNLNKAQQSSWFNQVRYCQYSIGNEFDEEQQLFFKDCTHCVHLAWEGLPDFKNELHLELYPKQHINFIQALSQLGVKHFTFTGSCLEYGLVEGELEENMICKPVTAYGKGKLKLLNHITETIDKSSWTWLRLFYMYGKGQHPKSILPQLKKAIDNLDPVFNMSGGEQERDYLPVDEIAKIIVNLSVKSNGYNVVNLCSGVPIRITTLIENFLTKNNATIKLNKEFYSYPDYEPMRFWGSTKKLQLALHEKSTN